MDIKNAIIEVLTEHTKATTHEIADTYLMLPRPQVHKHCIELAEQSNIAIYNTEWYLSKKLIQKLIEENNRLEVEIDILYRENVSLKNVIIATIQQEGKRRE